MRTLAPDALGQIFMGGKVNIQLGIADAGLSFSNRKPRKCVNTAATPPDGTVTLIGSIRRFESQIIKTDDRVSTAQLVRWKFRAMGTIHLKPIGVCLARIVTVIGNIWVRGENFQHSHCPLGINPQSTALRHQCRFKNRNSSLWLCVMHSFVTGKVAPASRAWEVRVPRSF